MDECYHSCDCWCHCSARRETGDESLAVKNNKERKGGNKIALRIPIGSIESFEWKEKET